MRADRVRFITGVTLAAGAMDATTGLLLVLAPATIVSLLGATPGADASVWVRYIGAFVGGIGLCYGWALATTQPAVRARRLPGVWGATAVVRIIVALFCTSAVASGALGPRWLIVAFTDGALATLQVFGLCRGWFE